MELEQLDVVSRCMGQTLNPQERSSLEIGLLKRKTTEALVSIRFWGRLVGETQDYVIAVGLIAARDYPKKKFYFCTNSSPELQQFPELTKAKIDAAAQLTTRLKGDPTLVLSGDEPQNADDGETPFSELDRLAYLVDQIDRAIAVVPLGAFVVAPQRQVVLNAAFHGLKWEQATQIFNYFHLREPELPEKLKALHNADGLVRASDFLDPLVGDLDGSWDLAKDNTGSVVTLRSLAYPGAFFFHEPETSRYGSVYFGDGRKNPDLAFMI